VAPTTEEKNPKGRNDNNRSRHSDHRYCAGVRARLGRGEETVNAGACVVCRCSPYPCPCETQTLNPGGNVHLQPSCVRACTFLQDPLSASHYVHATATGNVNVDGCPNKCCENHRNTLRVDCTIVAFLPPVCTLAFLHEKTSRAHALFLLYFMLHYSKYCNVLLILYQYKTRVTA